MKKRTVLAAAALAWMLLLPGCVGGVDTPAPDPAETLLGEIGKSFDEVKAAHPEAEHLMTTVPGAAGLCLGEKDGPFYFFFGAQDGPTLEEMSDTCGGQLRCAGIGTTVDVLYPEAGEETALEQFCADHGIADYTYTTEDSPGQNWLMYDSDGKAIWLYTAKGNVVGKDDCLYVIDQALELENLALREEYWEKLLLSYTSLIVDGQTHVLGEVFSPGDLFADAEQWQEENLRTYWMEGRSATTLVLEDREQLTALEIWGEGETLAGIRVGSTLEEAKAAYPEGLCLLSGVYDTGAESGLAYSRAYAAGATPLGDGLYTNMILFVNDGKVVKLRIDDGMSFGAPEVVLGMDGLLWERIQGGDGLSTRYFTENADGTETELLRVQGIAEHHDLDGDGILELLISTGTENSRDYGIYDMVDGALLFTDVNDALHAQWSGFLGDVSNLADDTFRTCFQVGMEAGKDGDVYSYADGEFTYQCTFAQAMGWAGS